MRGVRRLVAAITVGTVLNPLDATMIAVVLPGVQAHFAVSLRSAAWLVSAYLIASAVGQTLMGRLADQFGARRVFRAGLSLAAVACAGAALSPSFGWLVFFRVVQALGSSVAFPAGLALIRKHVPEDGPVGRARAIGTVQTVLTAATAVGPFLGGLLATVFGWRAVFAIDVPLALAAVVLAGLWMPRDDSRRDHREIVRNLDLPGAFLYAAVLVSLLGFLLLAEERPPWLLAGAASIALVLFAWRETRVHSPFLDVRMLARSPGLVVLFGQYCLVSVAQYLLLYALPQWLQTTRDENAAVTGLVVLPIALSGIVITPIAGRLIQRYGSRPVLLGAGVLLGVGGPLLLLLGISTPLLLVAVVLFVLGGFNNPATLGLQMLLYRAAPAERTATLGGAFQSFRYIGSALSTTVLATVFVPGGGLVGVSAVLVAVAGAVVFINLLPRSTDYSSVDS